MIHPLKITSTLADETRYSIYEYILQEKKQLLYNILLINSVSIQTLLDFI